MHRFFILLVFFGFLTLESTYGRELYGIKIDDKDIHQRAIEQQEKLIKKIKYAYPTVIQEISIEKSRKATYKNFDFLAITLLLFIPGLFRVVNPGYLKNMFKAFRNPVASSRQLKSQLYQNSLATLVFDVFIFISFGFYIFYVVRYIGIKSNLSKYPDWMVLTSLFIVFAIIYLVRYLVLKFTGWLLQINDIVDDFIFNIFLINKIIALVLLPFIVILAFGKGDWVQVFLLISFIAIFILLLNRYLRSGSLYGYFLKFSKFHFFMYLCAFEILPLAILIKLMNEWIIV